MANGRGVEASIALPTSQRLLHLLFTLFQQGTVPYKNLKLYLYLFDSLTIHRREWLASAGHMKISPNTSKRL